jgi:hypothetical protein
MILAALFLPKSEKGTVASIFYSMRERVFHVTQNVSGHEWSSDNT